MDIVLVKMHRPGSNECPRTADVHPAEVENMKACGWEIDTSVISDGYAGDEKDDTCDDSPCAVSVDSSWTLKELRAYATENEIALSSTDNTKAKIIAVIEEALAS